MQEFLVGMLILKVDTVLILNYMNAQNKLIQTLAKKYPTDP